MTKTRMALIAVACVAAGAEIDVATDGGEPPRERTRAEALPLPLSLIGPVGTSAPSRATRTLASLRSPAPASSEDLWRVFLGSDEFRYFGGSRPFE
jgi:hypothetical protein